MHTFLLIVAVHAVVLGFGFSFAGCLTLLVASDAEEAAFKESYQLASQRGWFNAWLCRRRFRRDLTSFSRMMANWTNRPEARKLLCAGLAFLAIAAILGLPLGAFK
jgi:hypothetical protein